MFSTTEELVEYIKDNDVEVFDIRFCDLPGIMNHLTVPAATVTESRWRPGWPSTARRSAASSRSTSRT